jgi:hypothetical protein
MEYAPQSNKKPASTKANSNFIMEIFWGTMSGGQMAVSEQPPPGGREVRPRQTTRTASHAPQRNGLNLLSWLRVSSIVP